MKPVLIVEGKQYDVAQINYHVGRIAAVGVFDDNGNYKIFHDKKESLYIEAPLKIDISQCLKWLGRYDEVYETLDKVIEGNQREIQGMATEIADDYKPFVVPDKHSIREKLKERTYGLMDAQDIVHGFMEDDVDLSGGDTDATE